MPHREGTLRAYARFRAPSAGEKDQLMSANSKNSWTLLGLGLWVVCGVLVVSGILVVEGPNDGSSKGIEDPSERLSFEQAPLEPAAGHELGPAALRRRAVERPPLPGGKWRVSGRVLAHTGRPLGGALVGELDSREPVVTSRDGSFQLITRTNGTLHLLVIAQGHAPRRFEHVVARGLPDPVLPDLQLLRGGDLKGRVVDERGEGVPSAVLTLTPGGAGAWLQDLDLDLLWKPVATDAGGHFSIHHLPAGTYTVAASAPTKRDARARSLVLPQDSVLEVPPLVMRAGGELRGKVVDAKDGPLAEAQVRVFDARGRWVRGRALTDAEGHFEVRSLPAGSCVLEVTCEGHASARLEGVDLATTEDILVRLAAGLHALGQVVDASSGLPVERFAIVARRLGSSDPGDRGTMTQQLDRRIEALRERVRTAGDVEDVAWISRTIDELAARRLRLQEMSRSQPVDSGEIRQPAKVHPDGSFRLEGLDEGLYVLLVDSPDHAPVQSPPFELKMGEPPPALRLEVHRGAEVRGRVVWRNQGKPLAGVPVELVRVVDASEAERRNQRSLYSSFFAARGPVGVTIARTQTKRDGVFSFPRTQPGTAFVMLRDERIADHDTAAFSILPGMPALRIEVGARAVLEGRVRRDEAHREGEVDVWVLGGHGTFRSTRVNPDGTYRFERLQPGSYLVRAYPADSRTHVNRLFGSLFPLHAGAVKPESLPPFDVTLIGGETRVFEVSIDLPPMGTVLGSVTVNGAVPGRGRARLRPIDAPSSGGLSLSTSYDQDGRFEFREVPVGRYTLLLQGATSQVLHEEEVHVRAGTRLEVHRHLVAGALRGKVTWSGGPQAVRGRVWILPGAESVPQDLHAYRRSARVHRLKIQGDGTFGDAELTPGRAFAIVDVPGWHAIPKSVIIPSGGTARVSFALQQRKE